MHQPIRAEGFTFVEVVVATAVLMVAWLAVARIVTVSTAANAAARASTQATLLAVEKIEQLRSLPYDDGALADSPPSALTADAPGYFDTPDDRFKRRWSIERVSAFPDLALTIRVSVIRTSGLGEAHLATIRARKGD